MITNYADHAANERTFLSWVRTTVAIVGLGLAAARLSAPQTGAWSELALLGSGAVVISVAYLRMLSIRLRIARREELDDQSAPIDALLVLLLAALLVMLAVFGVHVS